MPIANATVASETPIERSALPVVSELVQKVRELLALVFGERRERLAECFTPLAPHASSDLAALVGQRDARASRIVRIRLASHETVRDPLLHESRGARLIDTDRRSEVAHTQGRGSRGERFEHPHPGRSPEAAGRVVHPRRHAGMNRVRVTMAMIVTTLLEMIRMRTAMPAVGATHSAGAATAFTRTASAQTGQGAGDGLGGVVLFGAHPTILHAT